MPFSCNSPELLPLINKFYTLIHMLPPWGFTGWFCSVCVVDSISHREVSKEWAYWNLPFGYWPQVTVLRHSIMAACSAMTAVQPSTSELLKMRRPKWTCSNSLSCNSSPSSQPWEVQEASRREPSASQRSLRAGTLCCPPASRALAHSRSPPDQGCRWF